MKKLSGLFAIALCLPLCFVACAKTKKTNSKTFEKYFSTCQVVDKNNQTTYTTSAIFSREKSVYSSLKFVADTSWTEHLNAEKIIIEFAGSQTKDVDMIVAIETNGQKQENPLLVCFEEGKTTKCEIPLDTTFQGETSIQVYLSNPGKNGYAGDIFDAEGFSNGFVWKIENIELFGSH